MGICCCLPDPQTSRHQGEELMIERLSLTILNHLGRAQLKRLGPRGARRMSTWDEFSDRSGRLGLVRVQFQKHDVQPRSSSLSPNSRRIFS